MVAPEASSAPLPTFLARLSKGLCMGSWPGPDVARPVSSSVRSAALPSAPWVPGSSGGNPSGSSWPRGGAARLGVAVATRVFARAGARWLSRSVREHAAAHISGRQRIHQVAGAKPEQPPLYLWSRLRCDPAEVDGMEQVHISAAGFGSSGRLERSRRSLLASSPGWFAAPAYNGVKRRSLCPVLWFGPPNAMPISRKRHVERSEVG